MAGEGRLSLVWDTRDDGVEALRGGLVALRGSVVPVGDLTWLKGEIDLRLFVPFNADMGIGFRAAGSWVGSLSVRRPWRAPSARKFSTQACWWRVWWP